MSATYTFSALVCRPTGALVYLRIWRIQILVAQGGNDIMSTKTDLTRRDAALMTVGLAVIGSSLASPSIAAQPNMEAALQSLQDALASLQAAEANKAGHREKAIALVEQAIEQVRLGIEAAG